MRGAFWRLVHKMPCFVVHRLCSLCAENGLCPGCIERSWEAPQPAPPKVLTFGCAHVSISGTLTGIPTSWCGCTLSPIPQNRTASRTVTIRRTA